MEEHQRFTVSTTAYLRNLEPDDLNDEVFAVHYQAPPRQNANGSTSISMRFPTLLVAGYVEDAQGVADKVARILNEHWEAENAA